MASSAGHWRLRLDDGTTLSARAVIVASGVKYHALDVPDMDRWLAAYRTAHRANGSEPDAGRADTEGVRRAAVQIRVE